MKILMVCLGNICRSPLAQGILEEKAKENNLSWEIDSAGTSSWHIGEPPDSRSISKANEYNIDISQQRARQFKKEDFQHFDLILAMDSSNYSHIISLSEIEKDREKVKLILNYLDPRTNQPVPDPYFDGGFERVYQLLDAACDKVIVVHQKAESYS